MKTFKVLLISIPLVTILSACSLLNGLGLPTQTVDQNMVGTAVAMTLQKTQSVVTASTGTVSTAIASPMYTPFPPNTPVWLAYNYTCDFVVGGGNMTMNLAWVDRSSNEDGYKIHRDQQVIATLAPNSTSYVDVTFVPTGKTLSYSIEAFNKDWQVTGNTITYGCR